MRTRRKKEGKEMVEEEGPGRRESCNACTLSARDISEYHDHEQREALHIQCLNFIHENFSDNVQRS